MTEKKLRLDHFLLENNYFTSKNKAQTAIMTGQVLVNGVREDKCGTFIKPDARIVVVTADQQFVGRGGEKLSGALDIFQVEVTGKTSLDVGASTGGFTDCLLQRGCSLVYAIDVGYGQLDLALRKDPRVIPIERTNARHLDWAGFEALAAKAIRNESKQGKPLDNLSIKPVDLIVMDVSFISILKILPALKQLLVPEGKIVSLVKPQFEAGRDQVGKGGIITDEQVHSDVLEKTKTGAETQGYEVLGTCDSPIKGTMGNKEFFIYLTKSDKL